ncbi:MAG: DUF4412 domain-containing protein [Deltaproteobacteria bacterium]|nr:DUF4412 domain-containing protein [Deltaproteobacteria bacterium]
MKRIIHFWIMGLVCILTVSLSGPVHADFYFESEQSAEGVPSFPGQGKLIKTYLTAGATRTESGDRITIMNSQTMTTYELNPSNKTYTQHDMREMQGMPKMEGTQKEQLERMMKQMADSMKITPTKETRRIAGYDCRKYDVQFMMAKGVYWVTREIKGYDEFRKLTLDMAKAFEQNPMMKQMNVLAMMDQIDGFPVMTVMDVMGGKITTTLKMIEQKPLDKDLFEVPKGYTRTESQ